MSAACTWTPNTSDLTCYILSMCQSQLRGAGLNCLCQNLQIHFTRTLSLYSLSVLVKNSYFQLWSCGQSIFSVFTSSWSLRILYFFQIFGKRGLNFKQCEVVCFKIDNIHVQRLPSDAIKKWP